jgi:hypothetical protein
VQLIWSCRSRRPAHSPGSTRQVTTKKALLGVALGGCLSLGVVPEASAQPQVPTRLVWDGAVCGSAEDFAARVSKRSNVARFVQRGQRLVVRARIERRGTGLDASASIEARGHAPMVRRIESPDCNDALDALALVVAIGIEGRSSVPRAKPRGRRRPSPPEPPTPVEPPAELPPLVGAAPTELPAPEPAPTPETSTAPPAAPASEPAPEPAPPPPASPIPPPRAPAARALEVDSKAASAPPDIDLGVGLAAALSLGVAPQPLLGGALWISAGWARESVWSPELVLSASYQRLGGVARASGQADFALSVATLSLCPLRFGTAAFVLRPCASGTLGRLEVEGHATFDALSRQLPWRAVGGTLEGLARVGVVEFRAVLGAVAPLSRDRFSFDVPCAEGSVCEADVFHHVAPVTWSGAIGVGIRVW